MTQTPMQKAVEAGAKAIQQTDYSGTGCASWELMSESAKSMFRTEMRNALTAALASLEADGWKLMPREATKEMWIAGSDAMADGTSGGCWELMFNAAPEVD